MDEIRSKRDMGIDMLKTWAVFGVIVIHISSGGYTNPVLSLNWLSSVFWGSLTRASVPLFFMCSGALMLAPEKELSLKKLWTRNIPRLVVAMLVWAMAYKILHLAAANSLSLPALVHALKEVFLFQQEFHLYFLHIILIVYAFLPLTRVFTKSANPDELRYGLALWFALGVVYPTLKPFPPFSLLGGIPVQWSINMTYGAIGYGLLGYYLLRYPLTKGRSLLLAALGFGLTIGLTVYMSARGGILYNNFWQGMSVGVALLAAGLFCLCSYGKGYLPDRARTFFPGIPKPRFVFI